VRSRSRSSAAVLACALIGAAAGAQCPTFGPMTGDLRVSQSSAWDQIWCDVARGPGGAIACTWSQGQDVFARFLGADLAPLGGDLWVNSTLFLEVQDEPAIGWSSAGRVLVAWSDRHGYDGEQMGIFARLLNGNGTFAGSEFQVNATGSASQWRPLIAPRVGGGFLVAWSGDWDGDAYFRIYSDAGGPLSGEVRVHVSEFDAQVDPTLAQAPDGTILVAFVDFSGQGGIGNGLNLWGRTFDASGAAREAFEFPLLPFANGDQREPRLAVDGLGRFVLVYQDTLADGSANGIACRRYASDASPLGLPFVVNTTTASDQVEPRVACAQDGSFAVAWTDWSAGSARIRARRFDANAQPLGDEFTVNENVSGATRANVASSPDGSELVVAYDAQSDLTDVFARRWLASSGPVAYGTGKTNSRGCLPTVSASGIPTPSGSAPFLVGADLVLNNKPGFMLYGHGSSFAPFEGGTLLVAQPFRRVGAQDSGGNPPPSDCSGHFEYDFNARIRAGTDPTLVPGATISAQWYYRDLQDPAGFGTGLTNALRFTICP
jgi:hypothetical protein